MVQGPTHSGDSAPALTVHSAATAIEGLLSGDEPEDTQPDESQPDDSAEHAADESEATDADEAADSSEEDESLDDEDAPADDESEDAEPDAAEPEKPTTYKTKIDGQEVEVTLDEALKGYSRQADYTRKTQALAEREKAFDGERTAVSAERQEYSSKLAGLEQALTSLVQEPDWDTLRAGDPATFAQTHAAWQIHKQRLDALAAERQKVDAKLAEEGQRQYHAHLLAEQEKLVAAVPEWKNPAAFKKESAELLAYGQERGYSADELHSVADHRALVILRKAMLFDQSVKAKADATAKAKPKIDKVKTATPGSSAKKQPVTELARRRQRLSKTGRVNDAAAVIESMLD